MVVGPFAHKSGQYCHYGLMQSRSLVIIQDARPDIGDAPVMLISHLLDGATNMSLAVLHRMPANCSVFDCCADATL
jgi:hypothetical protein